MKILLCSHAFAPSIGGIETVSALLAKAFITNGAETVVVTQTPSPKADCFPYPVYRRPSANLLLKLVNWTDIVFHCNISLRMAWPLLWYRRPWVVAHHIQIPRDFTGRIKRYALRRAVGISVSQAVQADLDTKSVIIPNPYDDTVLRHYEGVSKDRDLVFLGRLEQYKGTRLLLDALMRLETVTGMRPNLTFVGSGSERSVLEDVVQRYQLTERVSFAGDLQGEALARTLNRTRIMVVPSTWNEPFGLVALEGIACGCAIIGASGGGLPEAIGPCGVTFTSGSVEGLTARLVELLGNQSQRDTLLKHAPIHLARHQPANVAREYLALFQEVFDGDATTKNCSNNSPKTTHIHR